MRFCSDCGASVSFEIPKGDQHPRYICTGCQTIHYQNPRVVVGTVCHYENQILLCRRAIEPRKNYWTIPAGYLELGETTEAGALREALEEANALLEIEKLLGVYSLSHISQIQIIYLARLLAPVAAPGEESLEVAFFSWHQIPWKELAFPSVKSALIHASRMLKNPHLHPEERSTHLSLDEMDNYQYY